MLMTTTRKILGFFLLALLAMSLTACSSKEAATADAFQKKLESLGYEVVDITAQYAQFEHIQKALGLEKGGVHIEFFKINSKDAATAMFNGNSERVKKFKSSGAVESSVSVSNYQTYSLTTDETYYTVSRIDDTLIYAYSSKEKKDVLQDILSGLDY